MRARSAMKLKSATNTGVSPRKKTLSSQKSPCTSCRGGPAARRASPAATSSASRSAWLAICRSYGVGCQCLIRAVRALVPASTRPGSMWLANSTVRPAGETARSASKAWMRPSIGSPLASRCGVFIRPSCGTNRSTSNSRPGYLRPPGAIAGRDQRRARHASGIQPVPDGLDVLQPGGAYRRPVHPHHQLVIPAADQQVQVQAAAQVTAVLQGDRPPANQHLPQLP